MKVNLTGSETWARIQAASELTDLRPAHRLTAKLDMSGPGIARRIKAASQMLKLCRWLRESTGHKL
jgi:hypothetical protein